MPLQSVDCVYNVKYVQEHNIILYYDDDRIELRLFPFLKGDNETRYAQVIQHTSSAAKFKNLDVLRS